MAETLSVKKFGKVRIKHRQNKPRKQGQELTISHTLEWLEIGRRQFPSLGKHATTSFALADGVGGQANGIGAVGREPAD